jgi:hypothetical protein
MATLEYKLEYFQGAAGPTDPGVYIQLRTDLPAYQHIITKEVYFSPENSTTFPFITAVFNVPGVVRLASQAWRLYIEASPVFKWDEVLGVPYQPGIALPNSVPAPNTVMFVVMTFLHCDSITGLGGSGLTLTNINSRRSF